MSQEKAIILDVSQKSAKAITTAVLSLSKVAETLAIYSEQVESLTEQVNIKTNELVNLDIKLDHKKKEIDTTIAEKERAASVDLKLRLKENEEKTLNELAKSRGAIVVAADVVPNLEAKLKEVEQSIDSIVSKAVTSARTELTKEHSMAVTKLELTNSAETAKMKAELDAKDAKIEFLNEQISTLNTTIASERQARIEIAKTTAQPIINVGTAK